MVLTDDNRFILVNIFSRVPLQFPRVPSSHVSLVPPSSGNTISDTLDRVGCAQN